MKERVDRGSVRCGASLSQVTTATIPVLGAAAERFTVTKKFSPSIMLEKSMTIAHCSINLVTIPTQTAFNVVARCLIPSHTCTRCVVHQQFPHNLSLCGRDH